MSENAKRVDYKDDDGNWCYALVESSADGNLTLLYKAHVGGGWERATVPADSDRVR